ncbi:hypothetical protein ACFUNF_16050, partial [Streptomyces sp. NPDC057291]
MPGVTGGSGRRSGGVWAKAFAYFGTVAGVGVALGPSLSGALVRTLGWRRVFAVHAVALVVVLIAVPAISKAMPVTGSTGARIDFAGSALFVVAMVLLTTAIVQGSQWGWGSVGAVALFAGAIVVLAVFAFVGNRREHPRLDLGVLRNRRFVGLCLVPVAGSIGFVTMLTYLPSCLTAVTGRGTGAAGLIMVLLTAPALVCPMLAAQLVTRGVSALTLIYVSLACLIVGDVALTPSPCIGTQKRARVRIHGIRTRAWQGRGQGSPVDGPWPPAGSADAEEVFHGELVEGFEGHRAFGGGRDVELL